MRNLRKAAVVVAVIGSVSTLGAGVASAHGDEGVSQSQRIHCTQVATNGDQTTQIGLINLSDVPLTLIGTGPARPTATQQICGNENSHNENESRAHTGLLF